MTEQAPVRYPTPEGAAISQLLLDAGRRRSPVTAAELDAVADELNARRHERVDFATPTEQLSLLLFH